MFKIGLVLLRKILIIICVVDRDTHEVVRYLLFLTLGRDPANHSAKLACVILQL